MASTAIVVKRAFLDKEDTSVKHQPGTPLKVSADRAKYLVEHGFAAYSGTEEAETVKAQAEVTPSKKK